VSFDQIDGALELLEHDVAVGSRCMPGGSAGKTTAARVVLSRGGNLLMRFVLGLRCTDTRAPLKVCRGAVADRLFPALRLNGFVKSESGQSSSVSVPRDAVRSIFELFAIRWWWFSGRYAAVGTRTSRQRRR
jgi:hypothetical protein